MMSTEYRSIEESNNFATNVSFSALLMGEDALGGAQDQVSELSGWQNAAGPLLEFRQKDVVSGRNDSAFVDSADQFDDYLFASVVVDDLELSDVVVLLHDSEELDEHFGDWSQDDLLLALALSVDDCFKSVSQNVYFHHTILLN